MNERVMTDLECRLIADAARRRHVAQLALEESDRLGQRQSTRDNRKELADADQQLHAAIVRTLSV